MREQNFFKWPLERWLRSLEQYFTFFRWIHLKNSEYLFKQWEPPLKMQNGLIVSVLSIVFLLFSTNTGLTQVEIDIFTSSIAGRVCLPGFSNTATEDTDAFNLRQFFENNSYSDLLSKSAFGKFHRIPIRINQDMSSIVSYDKGIGREPILLKWVCS